MDKLPEELLIEIFVYLNFADLCQLISTCKSFNEVISNSSTLMDKFRFVFNKKCKINLDLMMQRKYRRIEIKIISQNLFKLLECYGENIIEIRINLNKLNSQDLSKMLKFCHNLNILKIDKCVLNDDLIQPLLNSLPESVFNFNHKYFLEYLPEIKGKILKIHKNSISKSMLASLFKQNQLKHLELKDYELFDDDKLVNADFQLESLVCSKNYLSFVNEENFKKFLTNQKNLRRLIIISDTFDYIQSFECVNIFKSINEQVLELLSDVQVPLPQIEMLKYKNYFCLDRKYKENFPNLKNLSFDSVPKFQIVKKFTGVYRTITISDSVKTLVIKNVKFENDSLFDDDVDIRIENLTISECDNINWLIDCVKNDRIKLKSLTIDRTDMKKSQREFLESLTQGDEKKIEKLKIYMPMELNENHDYVCDYLKENEEDDVYGMAIPEWLFSTISPE